MKSFLSTYSSVLKPAADNPQLVPGVSRAGDRYEQQADAMAGQVVNAGPGYHDKSVSESIQRSGGPGHSSQTNQSVPGAIEKSVAQARKSGNPLPDPAKSLMESQIGADFSGVRIHTDANASRLSESLNAHAFTVGNDIFFNQNKWNPGSTEGKRLLAHELIHTVQQKASSELVQRDEISYRSLKWDDFYKAMDESLEHDAYTYAGIKYKWKKNLLGWSWNPVESTDEGLKVEIIITYDPSKISLEAFMSQEESMKKLWLTDDSEAKKEFGENANITQKRSSLLKHEQLHFRMAKKMAEAYNPDIKAAVPKKEYKITQTVADEDGANTKGQEIYDEKSEELAAELNKVVEKAMAELSEVQDVYDTATDHSEIEKTQKEWEDKFDEKFKEARKEVKDQKKAEEETETAE